MNFECLSLDKIGFVTEQSLQMQIIRVYYYFTETHMPPTVCLIEMAQRHP